MPTKSIEDVALSTKVNSKMLKIRDSLANHSNGLLLGVHICRLAFTMLLVRPIPRILGRNVSELISGFLLVQVLDCESRKDALEGLLERPQSGGGSNIAATEVLQDPIRHPLHQNCQ